MNDDQPSKIPAPRDMPEWKSPSGDAAGEAGGLSPIDPKAPILGRLKPKEGIFPKSILPREFAPGAKLRLIYCFPGAVFFAIFFAFGMQAVGFTFNKVDYGIWFRADDWGEGGHAKVSHIVDTGAADNDRTIWGYHYTFKARDGREYEGVSYDLKNMSNHHHALPLRYDPDDSSNSILVGMRRQKFPPFLLFIWLFPLVGAAGLFFMYRSRRRLAYLLRYSPRYHAVLARAEHSNTTVNDRTHKVTYAYIDQAGVRREYDAGLAKLPNENGEYTLLLPPEGGKGRILEHERAGVQIDERGTVSCRGSLVSLIWIPIVIAGFIGAYLMSTLL